MDGERRLYKKFINQLENERILFSEISIYQDYDRYIYLSINP